MLAKQVSARDYSTFDVIILAKGQNLHNDENLSLIYHMISTNKCTCTYVRAVFIQRRGQIPRAYEPWRMGEQYLPSLLALSVARCSQTTGNGVASGYRFVCKQNLFFCQYTKPRRGNVRQYTLYIIFMCVLQRAQWMKSSRGFTIPVISLMCTFVDTWVTFCIKFKFKTSVQQGKRHTALLSPVRQQPGTGLGEGGGLWWTLLYYGPGSFPLVSLHSVSQYIMERSPASHHGRNHIPNWKHCLPPYVPQGNPEQIFLCFIGTDILTVKRVINAVT